MTDTVVELPISGQAPGQTNSPDRGCWCGTFLAGPENSLVVEAVYCAIHGGSAFYNPLVFYGPPGVGKTHLAVGMVDEFRKTHGPRAAIHVTAIDFARQWNDALEAQATDEFHARYRHPKLVAIDDIDVLAERPIAQDELLHTIDALAGAQSRLVLTAHAPPGEIPGFSAGLRARLVGGLVVPVAPPERSVRLAAARKFAAMRGLDLPEEAAAALADGLPETLSAIWAAVAYLETSGSVEPDKPTERRVAEFLIERHGKEPSLREIAVTVARHFSVRVTDLRSGSRRRAVVMARDVAMYLARTLTRKSFDQIGAYFNGRDHSTVSHGCAKTAELVKTDPSLRNAVDELCRQFRGPWRDHLATDPSSRLRARASSPPSGRSPLAAREF